MADDVDLASQHEEAFRQHQIAHYREEELSLTGRCYNCEDQPRIISAAKNAGNIGRSENILIVNGGLNDATH
ncbi:hypothetical protein [Sodalis glossinidius]|uniref:hypothetical protein n=1 Tax=Sodalis glossinidius TaxID=63612 RepID=UPI001FB19030|nr:hypothetical protein [Sodalis glossinidius]